MKEGNPTTLIILVVLFLFVGYLYLNYKDYPVTFGYRTGNSSLLASPYYAVPSAGNTPNSSYYNSSSSARAYSYYNNPGANASSTVYSYYNTPTYTTSYTTPTYPEYSPGTYYGGNPNCYSTYEQNGNPIVICH